MINTSRIEMNQEEANLIDKWIYLLLFVDNNIPIKNRIRFMLEYFLFSINHNNKLFNIAEFYPYYFGPYSTRVAFRINILKSRNLIVANFKHQDWEYRLTNKGLLKAIKLKKDTSDKIFNDLKVIKTNNKRTSLKTLLRHVHANYPEYTSSSIIYF